MPAALLAQGRTAIRDALKTLITHIVVSDASDAFVDTQTGINPTTNKSVAVAASTEVNVDGDTFDATCTIDGTTTMTNKNITSIGVAKGTAVMQAAAGTGTLYGSPTVGTDCLSRTVRTMSIGVQSGDSFVVGVRGKVEDNS